MTKSSQAQSGPSDNAKSASACAALDAATLAQCAGHVLRQDAGNGHSPDGPDGVRQAVPSPDNAPMDPGSDATDLIGRCQSCAEQLRELDLLLKAQEIEKLKKASEKSGSKRK